MNVKAVTTSIITWHMQSSLTEDDIKSERYVAAMVAMETNFNSPNLFPLDLKKTIFYHPPYWDKIFMRK